MTRREFARLLSWVPVLAVSRRLMPLPADAASTADAEALADQVASTIRRLVEEQGSASDLRGPYPLRFLP